MYVLDIGMPGLAGLVTCRRRLQLRLRRLRTAWAEVSVRRNRKRVPQWLRQGVFRQECGVEQGNEILRRTGQISVEMRHSRIKPDTG